MNRDTTAQGTARVVESYRDHTRQSQRMHHYGPIVSDEAPDFRKGTIRGVAAVVLVFAVMAFAWVML